MIVCDRQYLRKLAARMKAARKALPPEVAEAIDLEIEARGSGRPLVRRADNQVGVSAYIDRNVRSDTQRPARPGFFQGNLPKAPVGKAGMLYGTWFDAMAVNKDTRSYRTWANPDEAIEALWVSHRLHRYERRNPRSGQIRLDQWRIEHGNGNGAVSEKRDLPAEPFGD